MTDALIVDPGTGLKQNNLSTWQQQERCYDYVTTNLSQCVR